MKKLVIDIGIKYIKIGILELKTDLIEPLYLNYDIIEENFFQSGADENLKKLINQIRKFECFKNAKLIPESADILIPDSQTYFQIFEMPFLTEKELISAIKYHAEEFIPIPFEEVNIDMETIQELKDQKKTKNLVVAATKNIINKIIYLIESADLIPSSIQNESTSLFRLLPSLKNIFDSKAMSSLILFINLGLSTTTIFLYNTKTVCPEEIITLSNGVDIFLKEIILNITNDKNKAFEIMKQLNSSNEGNNLEIKKILEYSFSFFLNEIKNVKDNFEEKYNNKINQIYLYGEGSFAFKVLSEKISSFLNLEVKFINPQNVLIKNNVFNKNLDNLLLFCPMFGSICL